MVCTSSSPKSVSQGTHGSGAFFARPNALYTVTFQIAVGNNVFCGRLRNGTVTCSTRAISVDFIAVLAQAAAPVPCQESAAVQEVQAFLRSLLDGTTGAVFCTVPEQWFAMDAGLTASQVSTPTSRR